MARLDPLARHDFMATLMSAVADDGISVVLSSHVVAELERVCDYLVVLNGGRVQVAGDVEELIEQHRVVTGPSTDADAVCARLDVVGERRAERQTTLLVRDPQPGALPPDWHEERTNLEELMLSYLRAPQAAALPGPGSRRLRASA